MIPQQPQSTPIPPTNQNQSLQLSPRVLAALTPLQQRVMGLCIEGLSLREIGDRLGCYEDVALFFVRGSISMYRFHAHSPSLAEAAEVKAAAR